MYISWLPHAGQTELTQVILALWGTYANLRLLFDVGIDAVLARHGDESVDTDRVAQAAVQGQLILTLIQVLVLITGVSSLFLPPPPPLRFAEMWLSLDPRGVMWVVQHVGLILTSGLCVLGAYMAGRERRRILRPRAEQQAARRAIHQGEHLGATASLFQQLGGEPALDGLVADLYARLQRDPVLSGYFVGRNVNRLQHAQAAMLASLLGGPRSSVDLREAHAHLAIPSAHFTRLAEHLRDTLQFFEVSKPLSDQVLAAVERTRVEIVREGTP